MYCKYYALFVTCSYGGVQTNTPLKRLGKQSLKAFDNLLREKESLLSYQNKYHQMAVETRKMFLLTHHKSDLNVTNQVCKEWKRKLKKIEIVCDQLLIQLYYVAAKIFSESKEIADYTIIPILAYSN